MNRRTLLKAGLTAVPAGVIAVAGAANQPPSRKIVINSIHDDPKAHHDLLQWAKANGIDPMQWALPVTIDTGQRTITGQFHPKSDGSFSYDRTMPYMVDLPKSISGN